MRLVRLLVGHALPAVWSLMRWAEGGRRNPGPALWFAAAVALLALAAQW